MNLNNINQLKEIYDERIGKSNLALILAFIIVVACLIYVLVKIGSAEFNSSIIGLAALAVVILLAVGLYIGKKSGIPVFECPHCNNPINIITMPWQCGSCGYTNNVGKQQKHFNATVFDMCMKCELSITDVRCPHCKELLTIAPKSETSRVYAEIPDAESVRLEVIRQQEQADDLIKGLFSSDLDEEREKRLQREREDARQKREVAEEEERTVVAGYNSAVIRDKQDKIGAKNTTTRKTGAELLEEEAGLNVDSFAFQTDELIAVEEAALKAKKKVWNNPKFSDRQKDSLCEEIADAKEVRLEKARERWL